MNVERKSAKATITSADDSSEGTGTFDAVLSTGDKDRDGEYVKALEWQQPLPERIPLNSDHRMDDTLSTIGSGTPTIVDGKMHIKGTYASTPEGQKMRTLVNEGHVGSMSVEFLRFSEPSTDAEGKAITKVSRELLGGAFTNYPANTQARILASKAGARNNASDAKNIQDIHDASNSLGANCVTDSSKSYTFGGPDMGDDPKNLLAAADASVDSALELLTGFDLTTLPPIVQQAISCVVAADASLDELMDALGIADPDESTEDAKSLVLSTKDAVSDKPWSDFSQADYSLEQWKKACVVHPDADSDVKSDYKLPIREPNGTLNRNAVHAAAGRVHQLDDASKSKAAKTLLTAYKTLQEDPPTALTELAGKSTEAATETAAIAAEQVADKDALNLMELQMQALLLEAITEDIK